MSVGQLFEILTMFVLGITLKNMGWRTTMIVGILAMRRAFAVYAFFPRPACVDHHYSNVARCLLCVFLRDGVYLRR